MSIDDRCTEIEIQVTRQESLIEQLNQVIYEQQLKIDQMEKRLLSLEKKEMANIGPAGEKPPHYRAGLRMPFFC